MNILQNSKWEKYPLQKKFDVRYINYYEDQIFKSDFNTHHILICTITRTPYILFKYNKSDFGRIF